MKKKRHLIVSVISLLFLSIFFLSVYQDNMGEKLKDMLNNREENPMNDPIDDNIEQPSVSEEERVDKNIKEIINSMTLEEKVGQLFIVKLEDINNGIRSIDFNEVMADNLSRYNVGGVIFFSDNIVDREQVKNLINNIQDNSRIHSFISVDEEGGTVARIGDNISMNTTAFEDMVEVGATENYNRAYEIGSTIGREIHGLGFNLDFAPVADVITNPNNTEIGIRSFGSDPKIVAGMVGNVVKGLQENGVSATLKHFPGHGGSEANSHNEFSYTFQDLQGMRETEFLPFIAGIKQGVDFIMISHISAPNVTGDDLPSSLSSVIITDLLRNELGYNNVITTDALDMKAVTDYYSSEDAAIMALKAGADILLMPPNFPSVYSAIINAVNENIISEERINKSVERILRIKIKRNLISEL